MKNAIIDCIGLAIVLALFLLIDLIVEGIVAPEKMDVYAIYRLPVIGTTAKAQAQDILTRINGEQK